MNSGQAPVTDALRPYLTEQVKANRSDLVARYLRALQATLFTNRASVRPAELEQIAADEAEALWCYLRNSQPGGIDRGAHLCRTGLSEQSLLRLAQVTRQFVLSHVQADRIAAALDVVDNYQNEKIVGYVQTREAIILEEQEHIHGALKVALGRYTVEIKQIQDLAQRAAMASEFKSRFMAQISHELRTPLGALMGMSEMLQADVYGPLTPAQHDITRRILKNARALEHFFAELLDQSFIESGQLYLKEESFSPQALAEAVYSNCLPLALQKGLSLRVQVDDHLPPSVVGDRARTEQVLTNLVVNSIRYTKAGGAVIYVRRESETHWALQVEDTGIGISQENIAHIFEPFRQIDEAASRKLGGVGLGLAIVHQLVTAMDGTVAVKSKVGQGSTFTVVLPLRTSR